jgi:hypothetical protein
VKGRCVRMSSTRSFDWPEESRAFGCFAVSRCACLDRPEGRDCENRVLVSSGSFAMKGRCFKLTSTRFRYAAAAAVAVQPAVQPAASAGSRRQTGENKGIRDFNRRAHFTRQRIFPLKRVGCGFLPAILPTAGGGWVITTCF